MYVCKILSKEKRLPVISRSEKLDLTNRAAVGQRLAARLSIDVLEVGRQSERQLHSS